ncbi:MAG: hypothetical protein RLY87_1124 [Chloroflexota bacterium]
MSDSTQKGYRPSSMYIAPTIVVGLGGTGTAIIRHLKSRLRQAVGNMPIPRLVEFLAVDTEPIQNLPGEERLYDGEIAYIGDFNAGAVLENIDNHPHIKDWWFTNGKVVGSIYKGARQRRAVGRLSLYAKWGEFTQRLDPKIRRVQEISEKEKTERYGLDVERTGQVRVYILASVCGGTGSGTFIDAAFRVRKALGDEAEIIGILFLPSCFMPNMQSQVQKERVQGNAYAALRELNHFLSPNTKFVSTFPDTPFYDGEGNKVSSTLTRPFDSVFLVDSHNGKEHLSALREIQRMAAQFIYLDMITPIGKRLAGRRVNLNDLAGEQRKGGDNESSSALAIAGFVTASLVLPERVVEETGNRYAAHILESHVLGRTIQPLQKSRLRDQLREEWTVQLEKAPSKAKGDNSGLVAARKAIADRTTELVRQNFEEYGIRGAVEVGQIIHDVLGELIGKADEKNGVLESRIREEDTKAKSLTSTGNTLLRIFNRGDDDVEDQRRAIEGRSRTHAAEKSYVAEVKAIFAQLRSDIASVMSTLSRQQGQFAEWQTTLNDKVKEPEVNRQKSREQKPSDLFELATELGKEKAVEDRGRADFSDDLLGHYITSRVGDIKLDADAKKQLQAVLDDQRLVRFVFPTADDLRINVSINDAPEAFRLYKEAISQFLAGHKDIFERISVSDYLTWFYDHVPYSTAESSISRNSPIDPLRQLRYRAQSPFLNIDQAQLGTEHGFDTEPVRLLGASPLPKKEVLESGQHPLDEFGGDSYDLIDTGMPNRLDVVHARFGYKVDDLANLKEYYKSYRYFTETLGDPLHIHRDWPAGMSNLVKSKPGSVPTTTLSQPTRSRLRVIGDSFSHPRANKSYGAEAVIHRSIELSNGFSWNVSLIADDLSAENDDLARLWIRSVSASLEQTLRTSRISGDRGERLQAAFVTARQRATEDINRLARQLGRPERPIAYAVTLIEDDQLLAASSGGDFVRIYNADGTTSDLSGDGSIALLNIPANTNIVLGSDGVSTPLLQNALYQAVERFRTDPSRITDAIVTELRNTVNYQDVSLIAIRLIEA